MRALLSLTDKSGLESFARSLVGLGYELVSTGGTARAIRELGLPVKEVAEVTGFPEILDGRVKTLHPKVHGGLLGDVRLESHRKQMSEAGIEPFQVVCVNLYAFEQTVTSEHSEAEAIESIDIGGPAMIRAAAKNFENVTVVVDPSDYEAVAVALQDGGSSDLRKSLAAKAFGHTAYYDSLVSRYLSRGSGEVFPEQLTVGLTRKQVMRYGENPHQEAALYMDPLGQKGIAQAGQLWGKELSYNNYLDGEAAWELVADLDIGSCVIIKHGNPCGVASLGDFASSFREAKASDPISAFGGVAAVNGVVTKPVAEAMVERGNFLEVVIAVDFEDDALEVFKSREGWGQNVRLLKAPLPGQNPCLTFRSIRGGALVQTSDEDPGGEWQVVTRRQPTEEEWRAIRFAWKVVPHVKSNAIVVTDGQKLLGAGAGQMNRVQSVRLALEQAGDRANGAALASDAFFPFPDSIETAAAAGIAVVIQPGGSKKDDAVVARADELGLAMVLTGVRHFRH